MGHYISVTDEQRKEMLDAIGLSSAEEMYAAAPSELIVKNSLNIASGMMKKSI